VTDQPALTVAETVANALVRHGVSVIFGQSLPSAVILAAEARGVRQLAYRQENAGGAMADGYARVSGKISIVAAQNGPAATLLVAPLAEALKASIPIVALVQEVERPQADRNAFQELDHFALFQSCAKWVRRLNSADRVDDYVDAAFVAAGSGRPGPAVLLLPADLLRETATEAPFARSASYGTWPIDRSRPAGHAIAEVADAIAGARHPVVMSGGGVVATGAAPALMRLQEAAALPVFTTFMGKGSVDETHPLSCGVLGALVGPGSLGRHSRSILEQADLVVLVGTRTNQNGTDSWRLIPKGAKIVHIDIDPTEIGRTYEATRLVGDAAETLDALTKAMSSRDLVQRRAARPAREAEIASAWQAFEADRRASAESAASPIRPERVLGELQAMLDQPFTLVADASYSSMWLLGQLRIRGGDTRVLAPRGLAGLGWGLPMAIGAKVAQPERKVVAIVGDGGFGHSWAEIETLVRSRVAVTVIVLNNGILGFQKDAETAKFGAYTTACHFAPVDHAALARACGCDAERVSDPADLADVLNRAVASEKPWLIEVMADPKAHPPLSLFAGTLDQHLI
jgi:acetolactate synthase-1/2/3 large subunit